jgi:hypothetical protein
MNRDSATFTYCNAFWCVLYSRCGQRRSVRASPVTQRARYLSSRFSHCMIARAASVQVPLTSCKGGVSHHRVSGREHGFGQARWTAQLRPPLWLVLSPPREWRDPRLGRMCDGGGTRRRCLRSQIVSMRHGYSGTHELSRAMTARLRCTGPERTVLLRLSSVRLHAGSDGTAPAAPPGDRPGVSLHQWS